MTDTTQTDSEFLQGFDRGAEVTTEIISGQLRESAEARQAAEIRESGGDPERIAYIRENHPTGMNIEEWAAMENHFKAKDS